MMTVKNYIKQSPIHGTGLFAGEDIAAGTVIWEYNENFDKLIEVEKLKTLPPLVQEFIEKYSCPHLEDPRYIILEADNGRFMNHSETPNTDFREFGKGYAIQDIKKGEEFTSNYVEFCPDFELIHHVK
jgi:SET domain-containing protein